MPRITTTSAAALLALAVSAPMLAADPPPQPTPHPPAAIAGTSLVWCGDVETPRADPALYLDEPAYRGNQMPTQRVKRWARKKPGFVDVWIDRENNGWINVMFTQGVEQRQAQLERRFPGVGVVAVAVENSKRDLRRLARQVGEFVEERQLQAGWGWGNSENLVQLQVNVVTDELALALDETFGGEPLCVSGADPQDLVQPGPQPLGGDGWRMVAWEQGHGPAHEVGIAADREEYEALWAMTGLAGEPPAVDLDSNVVVWFAIGHGSSCPNQRMDEVIVDQERAHVYPLIVDPDNPISCTDDLTGAYQFVAALDRAELPAGPFEIGLNGGGDELWQSISVDRDLSATPGEPTTDEGT